MQNSIHGAALATLFSIAGAAVVLPSGGSAAADAPRVKDDGTIHIPAFLLPESSLLSEATRAVLQAARERRKQQEAEGKSCPSSRVAGRAQIAALRKCEADAFESSPVYRQVRARYEVTISPQEFGGVQTKVFTPAAGIAPKNRQRVLINLHGGGFVGGWGSASALESIPVASIGQIKVVSVDYRMAPEYTFPAATEDAVAVYRALLNSYQPKNLGIYGCSAGGMLTAQVVARLQKEDLPLPGAVGMFCAAGVWGMDGDSARIGDALAGGSLGWGGPQSHPYFKNVDPNDPLVFPALSSQILAKFPPSLLISSTRDFALSSVVVTHARLVALGVAADLHLWEGLGHGFYLDPDLPESREVHEVTVNFFDRHLHR